MSDGKRKPPLNLDELDEESGPAEGVERGTLHFTESSRPSRRSASSSGPKSSLTGSAIVAFVAFVMSVVMLITYAAPKGSITTLSGRADSLEEALASMSRDVDEAVSDSSAARAETGNLQADLSIVKSSLGDFLRRSELPVNPAAASDLAALTSRVQSLEAIIEEWEDGSGSPSDGNSGISESTRWYFEEPQALSTLPAGVSIALDHDRIEEGGLYDVFIEVYNGSGADINFNSGFRLIMTPRDYVMVDEDATYLDSDSIPFVAWTSDFIIREREGKDVCRRIEFETRSAYTSVIPDGQRKTFDLILELAYI